MIRQYTRLDRININIMICHFRNENKHGPIDKDEEYTIAPRRETVGRAIKKRMTIMEVKLD